MSQPGFKHRTSAQLLRHFNDVVLYELNCFSLTMASDTNHLFIITQNYVSTVNQNTI